MCAPHSCTQAVAGPRAPLAPNGDAPCLARLHPRKRKNIHIQGHSLRIRPYLTHTPGDNLFSYLLVRGFLPRTLINFSLTYTPTELFTGTNQQQCLERPATRSPLCPRRAWSQSPRPTLMEGRCWVTSVTVRPLYQLQARSPRGGGHHGPHSPYPLGWLYRPCSSARIDRTTRM